MSKPDGFLADRPLRVLIVEDNELDAELMVATLKRAGYPLSFERTAAREEFKGLILQSNFDLILSDHNLRSWTGSDALRMLIETNRNTPFVVVTATLGDEAAVEYIKAGAADYVLKHRLDRLPSVVGQVLREKAHRDEAARLQEHVLSAKRDWELTFDSVSDPIFLLDQDCRIRRANRATAEVLGEPLSGVIGRDCVEAIHGESRECAECPHRGAKESGLETHGDYEDPRLKKVFDMGCMPLRDSCGQVAGFVITMRDVTARRRAEEALKASEEEYRLMFDNNPQPMWVFDAETLRFLAVNDAAIAHYGYSLDEFLAMDIRQIRPPEDVPKLLDDLAAGHSGLDFSGEWRHRKKDETLIYVDIVNHPISFRGRPAKLVLAQDITQRKRLEEHFRQAQKMEAVGRLAGGVAHDFNNLLTVISGRSSMALEKLAGGDPVRESIEEIVKAADRAAGLTRQLLAFSRQQVLRPQVLDLNDVLSNMEKLLRRLIGEDVELVVLPGRDIGLVKADRGQVEQVLMNLAVNARDAMPQGGRLTIETGNVQLDEGYAASHLSVVPGPYVMMTVSDTGAGMDLATKARIFEPFFTTKEQGKGTGLGLATVYGIVKQSGGYIWVYSELGKGTTFKTYFPRLDQNTDAARAEAGPKPLSNGTETVLLVEDELALRTMVREVLGARGYRVLEAASGPEALKISQEYSKPIHALLTDVVMPGMSGRELAERVASLMPQLKIIYMSGYTDDAIVRHGILGANATFLQKPFSPDAVVRKVREVLDAKKA